MKDLEQARTLLVMAEKGLSRLGGYVGPLKSDSQLNYHILPNPIERLACGFALYRNETLVKSSEHLVNIT